MMNLTFAVYQQRKVPLLVVLEITSIYYLFS